jgi:Zn finger protein HypA/HybF involved in hydrogenase expression
MKSVRFKCPQCKRIVKIEGTDVKMCPMCGWKDIKIRREWTRNPVTQIRQNKDKLLPERKHIDEELEADG